jgi:exopolysaccharide production protein ExoQ
MTMQPTGTLSYWSLAGAPQPQATDQLARGERRDWLDHILTALLATLILLRTLIGLSPMSEGDALARAAGGNMLEMVATFVPLGLAMIIMLRRWHATLVLLLKTWPIWLLLGWFLISAYWTDYPGISLRRSIGTALFAIGCFGVAVGTARLNQLLDVFFWALFLVIMLNFAAFLLNPTFAVTIEGVRGIHTQKNVAGIVAMLAVLVGSVWLLAHPRPMRWLIGAAMVSSALLFLSLTESKTSGALTFVGLIMIPLLIIGSRLRPGGAIIGAMVIISAVIVLILLVFGLGFDIEATADSMGADLTFTGRTDLWAFMMQEILQRPILGYGYGAFWDVGLDNDPLQRAPGGSWLLYVEPGYINQAHHGYIDLWAQVGLPAMILGVWIFFGLIASALRLVFTRTLAGGERRMALFCVIFFVLFLVHNFMESSLWARGQMLANISILLAFLIYRFADHAAPASGRIIPAGWWPSAMRSMAPAGRRRERILR